MRLADSIITERLAGCVNVLPGITSVYAWEGKIERGQEHLLLIKTRKDRYPALEAHIRQNHPYELPEIIAVPVECGHPAYLQWIDTWLDSTD